ncbi:MAG: putative Multidrug resistance-associated protein 1 [Streblomastix strix]|uniref:Putative Multidrug resistance-associated protein 1 n=1 Tax=Streblomastix strix TaxID=222440 RepID=A0A5J4W228_9EUKA|nr:MAG: putative Multidrug resistance-associated protein 1 [Streblomastix strix]
MIMYVSKSKINSVDRTQNWPDSGHIQFDNVSFRYRSGIPYVFKDVSFDLKGGEKIGVCGRTGAGKSSILFALFRLDFLVKNDSNEVPNKCIFKIAGIDISKVELSLVRRSIAIISQDLILFTGTLRYNLDIEDISEDNEIWNVLGIVEMQEVVSALPLGLDIPVAEVGSNFSAGQRQLNCFENAILNSCKIQFLDEIKTIRCLQFST